MRITELLKSNAFKRQRDALQMQQQLCLARRIVVMEYHTLMVPGADCSSCASHSRGVLEL